MENWINSFVWMDDKWRIERGEKFPVFITQTVKTSSHVSLSLSISSLICHIDIGKVHVFINFIYFKKTLFVVFLAIVLNFVCCLYGKAYNKVIDIWFLSRYFCSHLHITRNGWLDGSMHRQGVYRATNILTQLNFTEQLVSDFPRSREKSFMAYFMWCCCCSCISSSVNNIILHFY